MLGAIIGDMAGSIYEWHNVKHLPYKIFGEGCRPTDDSVMTVAVARALTGSKGKSDDETKDYLIDSMKKFGRSFPNAGYGGRFIHWLSSQDRSPYYSWGNGSAMRVASVGWLYDSLEETLKYAKLSAEVTHNHPEGIKGAQAIAACIYLARRGKTKEEIREYVEKNFYKLDFTLDEIRMDYEFDVSCQGSCPQAIEAFLESENFEHAVKLAISIGGDSDTIAAMTGAIAEAFYGIPEDIKEDALKLLNSRVYRGRRNDYTIIKDEWEHFQSHILGKSCETEKSIRLNDAR